MIPETLKDMLSDEDFIAAQKALKVKGQQQLTKEERKQRQRTLDTLGVPPFHEKITEERLLMRKPTEIFQINVGLYCNQGGFQLKFVSINRVINHMSCYKIECSHW